MHCQLIKLIVIIVSGEISTWMLYLWHIRIPLFPGEGLYFPGFSRLNEIMWSLQLANQDKVANWRCCLLQLVSWFPSHCISFTSCRVTMGEQSGWSRGEISFFLSTAVCCKPSKSFKPKETCHSLNWNQRNCWPKIHHQLCFSSGSINQVYLHRDVYTCSDQSIILVNMWKVSQVKC